MLQLNRLSIALVLVGSFLIGTCQSALAQVYRLQKGQGSAEITTQFTSRFGTQMATLRTPGPLTHFENRLDVAGLSLLTGRGPGNLTFPIEFDMTPGDVLVVLPARFDPDRLLRFRIVTTSPRGYFYYIYRVIRAQSTAEAPNNWTHVTLDSWHSFYLPAQNRVNFAAIDPGPEDMMFIGNSPSVSVRNIKINGRPNGQKDAFIMQPVLSNLPFWSTGTARALHFGNLVF